MGVLGGGGSSSKVSIGDFLNFCYISGMVNFADFFELRKSWYVLKEQNFANILKSQRWQILVFNDFCNPGAHALPFGHRRALPLYFSFANLRFF